MIKKKVTRFIIPCLIALLSVFSSVAPSYAASYLSYSSHGYNGTLSWVTETVSNASTGNPSSGTGTLTGSLFLTDMTINWASPQSGTFDITLSGYNSGNVFLCENCRLSSYSVSDNGKGVASFIVEGHDYCRIQYYHATLAQTPTAFSGSWNRIAVSEIDAIKQIYTYMTQYMYDSNNGYSYLGHIDGTLATMTNYVNNIQNTLSSIYSSVDNIESYIDTLESSLSTLVQNSMLRDSVDIPIYSRFAYINLLRYGSLSDQYNYPYSNVEYGFFPTILTSNYSTPAYSSDYDIDVPAGKTLHFIYTISYWANIFDFINSSSNSVNPTVTMIEGNNYYRSYDVSYTNNTSGRIFLNISMNRNVNRPIIPLYLGVTVPQDVAMLFNMDFENTYTRLLQQIATGIGNISQQQIIENNTNINNYNNYQTSINNVENNYYQEFNTYETNIEQNNTFDFTGLSSDGVTVYHNLFTSVFQIDLIKWPLLITLLGLIIVIILG